MRNTICKAHIALSGLADEYIEACQKLTDNEDKMMNLNTMVGLQNHEINRLKDELEARGIN